MAKEIENRQRERGRFARSGLCATEHVEAFDCRRNGLGLNGGGVLVVLFGQGPLKRSEQINRGKVLQGCSFCLSWQRPISAAGCMFRFELVKGWARGGQRFAVIGHAEMTGSSLVRAGRQHG